MDFEQELRKIGDSYAAQGFVVAYRPTPDHLPDFARDFKVEIMARRGQTGALVSVKKNREHLAADVNMPRYAEVTASHPEWRFDVVVLEGETGARTVGGAREYDTEEIRKTLHEAEQMSHMGFLRPAVVSAWSTLEVAMRMRLRAMGEDPGWGNMPRAMLNVLYSTGVLNRDEFARLEDLSQVRNQIVHGFDSPAIEQDALPFLSRLVQRLVDESKPFKQSA